MAKAKKYSDWATVLVVAILLIATNLYWVLATRDMEERLDSHASAVLRLQDCYNRDIKPCN